jgi:hypothetical protein
MSNLEMKLVYQGEAIAQAETPEVTWSRAEDKMRAWVRAATEAAAVGWIGDEEKALARDEATWAEWRVAYGNQSINRLITMIGTMLLMSDIVLILCIAIGYGYISTFMIIAAIFVSSVLGAALVSSQSCMSGIQISSVGSLAIFSIALIMLFSMTYTLRLGYNHMDWWSRVDPFFILIMVLTAVILVMIMGMAVMIVILRFREKVAAKARMKAEATDRAHAAAIDAVAAVSSALSITKTWFQTGSQTLHKEQAIIRVESAVKIKNVILPKMIEASCAWTKADRMCKSVAQVMDPFEVTKLLVEVSHTVSEAKKCSMGAEAIYRLYRRPDVQME